MIKKEHVDTLQRLAKETVAVFMAVVDEGKDEMDMHMQLGQALGVFQAEMTRLLANIGKENAS